MCVCVCVCVFGCVGCGEGGGGGWGGFCHMPCLLGLTENCNGAHTYMRIQSTHTHSHIHTHTHKQTHTHTHTVVPDHCIPRSIEEAKGRRRLPSGWHQERRGEEEARRRGGEHVMCQSPSEGPSERVKGGAVDVCISQATQRERGIVIRDACGEMMTRADT